MAVTAAGSGPTTRLSISPERTDAHTGPYGVQAWGPKYGLSVQTVIGAWALGWQPGTPKQDLGVSVGERRRLQDCGEVWQRPCKKVSTLRYVLA